MADHQSIVAKIEDCDLLINLRTFYFLPSFVAVALFRPAGLAA
jgi:hypothetical protein